MGKIVEIVVELDDDVPEFMMGIVRCASVRSYDKNGKLCVDYKELVDNTPYTSEADLLFDVARRVKFPVSMIRIEE